MIVTEAEAKGLRCCADVGQVCRASICMGWRWAPQNATLDDEAQTRTGRRTHGFCGRAGPVRFDMLGSAP